MTRAGAGNQEDLDELEAQILRFAQDGQDAGSDEVETYVSVPTFTNTNNAKVMEGRDSQDSPRRV